MRLLQLALAHGGCRAAGTRRACRAGAAPPPFVDPATRAAEGRAPRTSVRSTRSSRPCTTSSPVRPGRGTGTASSRSSFLSAGSCPGDTGRTARTIYRAHGRRRLHRTRRAELPQAGLLRTGVANRVEQFGQHRPRVQHLRVTAREERRALRARHQQHPAREAGDRWWIASIMWDAERAGVTIPDKYLAR